ncbi:uncharacterized protein NESG_01353 [Nematocida ausubeli]|uniref:FAD/NAD(P)-binding domain-containing protein n=1 Tax=Nematocida ausubeli (strain ATCC PRA-371 / ERTm2) TaxID=1913371 RepID=A0A086J268_NEMA1|nr:uncharacterized protein NESG_01353 [Nematocida ausubeli]KAI5146791.1 thioredoxin reductase (NADPH) [Nematocida ausubeli]KFG26236.1 hypothetical protein NESG_01353 [Nematocida ausubeli]
MSISVNTESVVIIGSGPAAYSAAIYASKYKPLILAGDYERTSQFPGGQLMTTTAVDNYPGFAEGITGPELADLFKNHAEEHARTKQLWVNSVQKDDGYFVISTSQETFRSKAVIIATGSVAKKLSAPGVDALWQNGISACAVCDGWMFSGKIVMVIGGGDTAMEEVQYLAKIASKVILVHRSETFRARPDLLSKVKTISNVEIHTWSVLVEAKGKEYLESVIIKNTKTGKETELQVGGLFFAIGHDPSTAFLKSLEEETGASLLASDSYIQTDKETMQTAIEGLYAAGDVQDNKYRQAITAAYSGMLAGQSTTQWLDSQK